MASEVPLFYVMFLVEPERLFVFGISALLTSTQYLIISIISSYTKSGFEDIAVSLYDSDWYWLSHKDKKSMLKIMMLAQKPQAFSVGVFAESNLERFTDVSECCRYTSYVKKKFFSF